MQKTFEDFWSAYKEIHKKSRNEFFLKKASGITLIHLLLLLMMLAGGITVCALSDGKILLEVIGIVIVFCTIPFWVSTIKQIPISSTKEKTVQRICSLEELLREYKIDYQNSEVYKLLSDYITERTKRYNPFSYILEAIQSTANIAVLAVTFFSGSQKGTMTWDESVSWIVKIVSLYFLVRLILTVFQGWIVPRIASEREMGQQFLDDLHDLKLFGKSKE